MIRKSGMTINQCAQSFRFIRMLDSFGITDEPDPSYFQNIDTNYRYTSESKDSLIDPNKSNGERKKHHSPSLRDNFYYFIENIYNNCKKHDIRSSNVIRWIEDLIEINPSLSGNTLKILTEFENDTIEQKGFQSLSTNKKPVSKKPEDEQNQREVQIPFISKISGYIEQKKIKLQNLDIYKNKLEQEIGGLEEQKNILLSTITNLRRKESITLTYVDWYNSLKNELWNNHGIKLEEEVNSFAKTFNDFKYYNYDAHEIVKEYKQIESLRYEMEAIQGIVDSIKKTRDDTLKELRFLEERENYSRQSLDTLLELSYSGFGLTELKQLKNIIIEIAVSNDISIFKAGKKFFKDVENQYDNKLGFETKINEIRTEMKKLENEMPGYKEYLQLKVFMIGSLQYLHKFGVTDDDIISMTNIVTAYLNGNITFDPNLQSESIIDENKLIKKAYYWKSFISEIRNLGNINSQVIKQRSYLDTLKREIYDLNSQRQKQIEQILSSGQLLGSLCDRLSTLMEFLKQIIVSTKELNKIFIVYQPHFLIQVLLNGFSNDNDDKNEQK
jgi:hypothetical protein